MAFKHLSELLADQKTSTLDTSTLDFGKIRQAFDAFMQPSEKLAKREALQKEIKEEELIDLMECEKG